VLASEATLLALLLFLLSRRCSSSRSSSLISASLASRILSLTDNWADGPAEMAGICEAVVAIFLER
jgi:hypothetical protein